MEDYHALTKKFGNLLSLAKSDNHSEDKDQFMQLGKNLEEIDVAIQKCQLIPEDCTSIVVYCTSIKPVSEDVAPKICHILKSLYEQQDLPSLSNHFEDVILFISSHILIFLSNESLIYTALKIIHLALKNQNSCSVKVCDSLCSTPGLLVKIIEQNISKICTLEGLKIIQTLTFKPSEDSSPLLHPPKQHLSAQVISNSQKASLTCLEEPSLLEARYQVDCHICVASLSIIYNLLSHYPGESLTGLIVSVCQPYIFFKLRKLPKALAYQSEIPDMTEFLDIEEDKRTKQASSANRKRKRRLRQKKNQPPRSMIPADAEVKTNQRTKLNLSRSSLSSRDISLMPEWMKSTQTRAMSSERSTPVDSSVLSPSKENCSLFPKDPATINPSDPSSEASVRKCALHVMNAVLEATGKQNKFSFWPQLMCQEPSIMTCILRDPDVTARMTALQVVNTFLIDSNAVLSLATDSDDVKSFTTLSKQLGTSLRALHRCLALALLSEKMAQALIRILKTIELLFENVDYSKLKPGLLSKVVVHVKYFLKYKDSIVRANAFSAMVSFLKLKPKTLESSSILLRYQIPLRKEIKIRTIMEPLSPYEEEFYPGEESEEILQSASSDDCFSSDSSTNSEKVTTAFWILQRCVDSLLGEEDLPSGMLLQVKMQAIKVLNALITNNFNNIYTSLPIIQNVIAAYCNSASSLQRTEEGLVERVYTLLGSVLSTANCYQKHADTGIATQEFYIPKEEVLHLWLWALQGPLAQILAYPAKYLDSQGNAERTTYTKNNDHDCSPKIFLAGAEILANTSSYVLQEIGEEYFWAIFRTVKFLLKHPDIEFRLCGVRFVGSNIDFPAMHDSHFGVQIVRIALNVSCQILSSEEHNVIRNRLLSAWVLANISLSLRQCRATWEASETDPFLTKDMTLLFFKSAILGCKDKDTIRPPSIRSLGNLVSYLPAELVSDPSIRTCIDEVVKLLIASCVTAHMKSRWNACHALGIILKYAYLSFESADWMGSLISSLSGLVENFENFKVRILACSALCNISRRSYFIHEYINVWRAFMNGIEDLGNICGKKEVYHRNDLKCQLSYGICHLVTFLEFDDLEHLQEKIELSQDFLKNNMVEGNRLMPPAKANCFINAISHLNDLLDSDVIPTNQEKTLKCILSIIKI